MKKTTREIFRVAERFNLTVVQGSKHYKLYTPEGRLVCVCSIGSRDNVRLSEYVARRLAS